MDKFNDFVYIKSNESDFKDLLSHYSDKDRNYLSDWLFDHTADIEDSIKFDKWEL